MALEPLRLGDLTWADLVALARRRIAGISRGEWTLHAPIDPGITLLELFAWLLEQRVYWLDQVPDSLLYGLLELLGITPRPVRVAATVLSLGTHSGWRAVPAGTSMRLLDGMDTRFAIDHPMTAAPVRELRLEVGGVDRTTDLRNGRWVRVLRADGPADEFRLRIWFDTPPPAGLAAPLSLLVMLDAPGSVPPEWIADALRPPPVELSSSSPPYQSARAIEPPAPVELLYPRAGDRRLVPFAGALDGTGGLRRSGLLRLPIPVDWAPEPDGADADGVHPHVVVVRARETSFSAPPRITALHANAAIARHWRRVTWTGSARWLPLPGSEIGLERAFGAPIPWSVQVFLRERASGGSWQPWSPTADLAMHGSDARVVVVDRGEARVRFGDGLTGRVPVLADVLPPIAPPFVEAAGASEPPNVAVEYLAGGGAAGNLGAGQGWVEAEPDAASTSLLEATSVVAASGGSEAERIEDARASAASLLRARSRAVTRGDYEDLARATPGVAIRRAYALIGHHPGHPCVIVPGAITVFIVPDAPRDAGEPLGADPAHVPAPRPDPGALEAVRARLEDARLAGTEVFVRPPLYRRVALRFVVSGDPLRPEVLRARIREALDRFMDPLVGGDEASGWPFGEPVRPSALVRRAQAAIGRDGEVTSVRVGLDGAPLDEACVDVDVEPHALVSLVDVGVQLERARTLGEALR